MGSSLYHLRDDRGQLRAIVSEAIAIRMLGIKGTWKLLISGKATYVFEEDMMLTASSHVKIPIYVNDRLNKGE